MRMSPKGTKQNEGKTGLSVSSSQGRRNGAEVQAGRRAKESEQGEDP